nr:Chain D, Autophagy-related protein 3 [Plasmodium falciparum 3D7]4EOY_E Chain E, Autophagy-related protein 3 [Plasmodium falciparum 3D7]4EOY_F Chain F, Autophagy-related protein 3 [Plasmodium falciparum 3D7]
NDWLLPSY